MFCSNRWLQVSEETPAAVGLAALEDDWVDGEDYCDEEGNVDFEEIGLSVMNDGDSFFKVDGKTYFVPVTFVEEFKKAMHLESTAKKKNNIEVLKNSEFGEVRMVVIDNEPWFAAPCGDSTRLSTGNKINPRSRGQLL